MNVLLTTLMLTLAVTKQASALSRTCRYNDTDYEEGEVVATEEPCLFCVCRTGSLACNLQVCADAPDVPPAGCFLVQEPTDCCPQLFCEEGSTENEIELRTAFKGEQRGIENGCLINGSLYAEGSAVASSHFCEYCYCIEGEMRCIKPRCHEPFEGCRPVYRESSCCPMHYDCRHSADNGVSISREEGCVSGGVRYVEGQMVQSPNGSECESCYCKRGRVRCAPIVCSMDNHGKCRPVTSPDQCCPSGFACENNTSMSRSEAQEESYGRTETTAEAATSEAVDTEVPTEASNWVEASLSGLLEEYETSTHSGFQAVNLVSEQTAQKKLEQRLPLPATDDPVPGQIQKPEELEVKSKIYFEDKRESQKNSSEVSEDYDSYDYNEPTLPPSLPNLVIFPFVAADAVVKEMTPEKLEEENVRRMDVREPFLKDNFSPPVRTEGGFVPREPSLPSFQDNFYFDKEQNEQADSNLGAATGTSVNNNASPHTKQEADSFEEALADMPDILRLTTEPFNRVSDIQSTSESYFGDDSAPFRIIQKTAKPVTVAYKNIVVDYYPDYLITSTRLTTERIQTGNSRDDSPVDRFRGTLQSDHVQFKSTLKSSFVETPTTKGASLPDRHFKTTLLEDSRSTTKTHHTKFKYSSRIRSSPENTTGRQSERVTSNFDFPSSQISNRSALSNQNKTNFFEEKNCQEKEGKETSKSKPDQSTAEIDPCRVKDEGKTRPFRPEKTNGDARVPGSLLKLAGCNIYGRMYRVGKIILELSNPCSECVCTDQGVQCKELDCLPKL